MLKISNKTKTNIIIIMYSFICSPPFVPLKSEAKTVTIDYVYIVS